jgi:hypothetical protein
MFIRTLVLMAIAALGLSAHDAKFHKGNATEGEIVSLTATSMVMKTAKGDVNVSLNKDTKYEMGDVVVGLDHFKAGNKIAVIGTKLASGEIVAKEVVMPVAAKTTGKAGDAAKAHSH